MFYIDFQCDSNYRQRVRSTTGVPGVGIPLWFPYMGYIPLFWLYFFFKNISRGFDAQFIYGTPLFHQTLEPPLY